MGGGRRGAGDAGAPPGPGAPGAGPPVRGRTDLLAKLLDVESRWLRFAVVRLPQAGRSPDASPELERPQAAGPVDGGRMPTLALDAADALPLLLGDPDGWTPGASARHLAALAAFASRR